MNDRAEAGSGVDNAVADNLDDTSFEWEDMTSGIVESSEELSDAAISAEGTPLEGETQPTQAGQQQASEVGKAPAAQQNAAPAGSPPPLASAAQPTQATATAGVRPQPAPLFHDFVNANFDKAVDHIAGQGTFRLPPQAAEMFDEGTIAVLERQSAAVFLKTVSAVSQLMHETLPGVVTNLIGTTNESDRLENEFYTKYGFDKAQHDGQIRQMMQMLSTSNPTFTREQLMEETAKWGRALFGTAAPAATPPAQPAAAKKPANGKVIATKPFAPASSAAGGGAPKTPGAPPQKLDPLQSLNMMLASDMDMD